MPAVTLQHSRNPCRRPLRFLEIAADICRKVCQWQFCAAFIEIPHKNPAVCAEAGIPKKITFHAARHTFATTITLSQGVAIETISKLLGHKNIRTTQIYANITHSHISGEMERLSKRINSLCPDWTPSGMPNESERLY